MTGTGQAAPAAIEVDGLTKTYAGRRVVDDVSFQVAPGETFALLGPNGAGKTTTVEILEGYRRPDTGQVRVLGTDPAQANRDHRASVGLMLQGAGGIDPRMTAREVLVLYSRFHVAPRSADELLDLVGLETVARTKYRRLSGGERQRLALAVALVGRPDLVALDEPTAGMDVEARALVRAILGRLRDEGVTILFSSHDLVDVERVADRIAILDRGRIVAIGRPDELGGSQAAALRFRLGTTLAADDLLALGARVGSGLVVHDGDGRYRITGMPATPALIAALTAWSASRGILVLELRSGGGTLEERYVEVLRAAGDGGSEDAR